jgi:putative endonuclease
LSLEKNTEMQRGGAIYILTNKNNSTLYTGVTSNLQKRIYDHKNNVRKGSFSYRYNLNKLVYYEGFHIIQEAIFREKQIKAGSRQKKIELVNSMNPEWKDLYDEIC